MKFKLSVMTISMFMAVAFCSPLTGADQRVLEDRVAMNPEDYGALYNLGVAAFGAGDFKKAGAAFSALKSVCVEGKIGHERAAEVFYNAGNTEYKLHDLQAALGSFEAVLRYKPEDEKARQKRDFIKQLIEQQKKQEQQQQDKHDKQQDDKKESSEQQDGQQGDEQQQEGKQEKKGQEQGQQQQDKNEQKGAESQKQGQKENESNQQQQTKQGEQARQQKQQQGGNGEESGSSQQQQKEADRQKTEALTERQKQLIAIAEQLDNSAQEQIVRQQAGMRARAGGQHEW